MVPAFSLRNLQATHGRPKLLTARPRGPHRGSPAHGEAGRREADTSQQPCCFRRTLG